VATEPTIRHLFTAPQPTSAIDVAAIVRRSRARRLPKVLGATGVSVLAIGGLVFGGVQVFGGGTAASNTAGATTESFPLEGAAADQLYSQEEIKRAPAEKLNLCTGTVAEPVASLSGLVLAVHFADAPVGSDSVTGTVTMTNTGPATVEGYTAASPAITLAKDGVVVWHSNGPSIELAREVNLAPGQSLEYIANFSPVVCGVEDDSAESFRLTLPDAPVGVYQVSAAIDLLGEFDADLITGPAQTITLF
jgi:hypothetical protein